jgi:arylsulfatase A-like enzyme
MRRSLTLLLVAPLMALAASLLLGCHHGRPTTKPNVLLLVVDCLRFDAVAANGYPYPATPNLDRIAKDGTSFRHAISQASWTRPSLPTLLSGLYPSEHGVLDLAEDPAAPAAALDESVVTLAERLHAAGYATAMFGEQHQLSPRFGLQQGFDVWQPKSGDAGNIDRKLLGWQQGLGTQPFFAYLHYLELHWPYCPPRDLRGKLPEGTSTLNLCRDWRQLRDDMRGGVYKVTPADLQLMRARYEEELIGVDRVIGAMLDELQRRGVYDQTLIVVTGDHGEEFGEHHGNFHGQSLYDELLHVPLLIKPPADWKAPHGQVVDGTTETRNLVATFLDAGHVQPPPRMVSLVPWLLGEAPGKAPNAYTVSEGTAQIAVRTPRWKLIMARPGVQPPPGAPPMAPGGIELYDLARDPGEQHNVAASERRALGEMRQLLAAWQAALVPAKKSSVQVDPETRKGLQNLGYIR